MKRGLAFLFLGLTVVLPAEAADLPEGLCPFNPALIGKNFSASIVKHLGEGELADYFTRRERWYGPCAKAEPKKDGFLFHYGPARFLLRLRISGGKISDFGFGKLATEGDSWENFVNFLKKEWPDSALLVETPTKKLAAWRENDFLLIGDSRVLLLTAAVEAKIKAGKIKRAERIVLREADKANEIDELAAKPAGSAFSVADLEKRVFDRFDRTASDLLLKLLGADALESEREGASPFLSRRQFGWLMTLSPEEMAKLRRDGARAKAESLDRPDKIPPLPSERYDHMAATEWKGSTKELCASLFALADLPAFKNGLASRNFRQEQPGWRDAVYHAARDFGLAQTSWLARMPNTREKTCFSLTVNVSEFLDEGAMEEMLQRATQLLSAKR